MPTTTLKPLVHRAKLQKHAVFDIESNRWTQFEMAGVWDGRNYVFCESIETLVQTLTHRDYRGYIFYAHNGGRFDFLFVMKALVAANKTFKMVTQGARIIEIKIYTGKHVTRLRDSVPLLPERLKKLADLFCPEMPKGEIDFEKERVDKENPAHRDYLRRDCEILYRVIERYKEMPFIERTGPKLTRSSTALAAWRTTLKNPIEMTPPHVQKFVRQGYAGGRTEIFRSTLTDGYCVDVNSLYPAMMLKPLPVEYLGPTKNPEAFGFHEVEVHVPETYMPILWTKSPKLIFPTGTFRGTYFSEELKLAIEQGARITKYIGGHQFNQDTEIFREYILHLYSERKATSDEALKTVFKDLMNHCYGKFAEKETKKSFQRIDPNDPENWPERFSIWRDEKTFKKWGFVQVEKTKRSPHMLAHIAAAVTAWGRVHMAQNFYLPLIEQIAYTDTDSAYAGGFAPPTGPELGEIKLEYRVHRGFFLLPKAYYLETDHPKKPIIRKIKGFPSNALEKLTLENFQKRELFYKKSQFLTWRESLIRNNEFLSVGERLKSIRATYDKRRILKNGDSEPWHLERGEIKNG